MSTPHAIAPNAPATHAVRLQTGQLDPTWVWIMLGFRTVGFAILGLLIVGGFALAGHAAPWEAAVPWWPYQVIGVNLVCLLLLRRLIGREGLRWGDLIGWKRSRVGRDLLIALGLLVLALVAGGIGLFGLAFLLFGTPPPETMFQPLPGWALWPAMVLLPLTNSLAETVTYAGYALPRLEAILGRTWPAILIAAGFLSIQHAAFPLILEGPFLAWRAFSFIPLALVVMTVYVRLRRLTPIIAVHFLMDLQLMLSVLAASLNG